VYSVPKKYPSTGTPYTAVRVLGLNKLFWKVFYGWIYNPARPARAKKIHQPSKDIIPKILVLDKYK
jgi:hypothetical protein